MDVRRPGRMSRLLPLLWLLLTPAITLSTPSLEQQRSDFLKAERALANGDTAAYRTLSERLRDYPLYPYLEYQQLLQQIDALDSSQVELFLSSHSDTPL